MKIYWDLVNETFLKSDRKPNVNCIVLPENIDPKDGKYLSVTPREVLDEYTSNRQVILKDAEGNPILDADGNEQPVQDTDAEGNLLFLLNEEGEQLLDNDGNPQPIYKTEEYTYTVARTEYDFSVDTAQKLLDAAAKDKRKQIEDAYASLNADVYAEMAQIFGTNNPESATAYEATWKLMKEFPADYASLSLTSRFAIAGLAVGDALDTEQKVLNYATAKIEQVKTYSKNRMQRIEQFRAEREQILNS